MERKPLRYRVVWWYEMSLRVIPWFCFQSLVGFEWNLYSFYATLLPRRTRLDVINKRENVVFKIPCQIKINNRYLISKELPDYIMYGYVSGYLLIIWSKSEWVSWGIDLGRWVELTSQIHFSLRAIINGKSLSAILLFDRHVIHGAPYTLQLSTSRPGLILIWSCSQMLPNCSTIKLDLLVPECNRYLGVSIVEIDDTLTLLPSVWFNLATTRTHQPKCELG
jgi:hypothetical protein